MEKNNETRNQEDSSRREDRNKSKRREDEDIRGRERERSKNVDASKEREKEDPSEHERKRSKDKRREKDHDKYRDKEYEKSKGHKDGGRERDLEKEGDEEIENERGRDKDRGKEKSRDKDREREREKERDRGRDRGYEKDRHKHKHRDTERENDKDKYRDASTKDKSREKERGADEDKERSREREKGSQKLRDEGHDVEMKSEREDVLKLQGEASNISKNDEDFVVSGKQEKVKHNLDGAQSSLEQRISKMKEERLKSEGTSEILSWVNRSRKIPVKRNSEKEKALMFSRNFEEQDDLNQRENEDGISSQRSNHDLGGVKVLHGIEKVIQGGAVVLTLKDQSILADGDINEELDMLENVEIGEQKRRDDAYKAAKKKTGTFEDKFNDDPGAERKMLPQYDDSIADEGVTLDASGHFTGDAAKKLEELRKRIQGASSMTHNYEDLNSSGKLSSDYYTTDEMLQFRKPKKKKSIRKKEKLDIEALEAEAVSTGLGSGDLGSRNDVKRKAVKEERERSEAEMKSNAYKTAYAKADEASKALRMEQTLTIKTEDDDEPLFGDDDEDLRRSLERARKLALKKQDETVVSGPQAIAASLASSAAQISNADDLNPASGEPEENKVVFTEMEEFVWGLQLDEESHNTDGGDVFMEEDEIPRSTDVEMDDKKNSTTELKNGNKDEPVSEDKQEISPDDTLHETAVGKGLSGALKLLKDRGTLKETIEWGGRNMDKKKSKLVGIYDANAQKEIRIERTDEYGRILTPKEAFRQLSHKFHGKGPGKMKIEKRQREYQEELKRKKMKNDDTPSLSVERMREAQSRLKTPYLVLSGNVKPGQTSDPQSGFATVEKNLQGSLTPMLGDRKVEHFLGIRKADVGDMGPPKNPRT
ncbi:SART-1 family protein DOT2 [Impatiens glandulifera]|uniref:SART-1 family protein DOT2 n=1 Tax=Impatiens glandulifera TaxID=253017 RepID=UPI001FB162DB|nr:SART-1 family protein DOT2 [Impatiens glandulifera]